MEKRNLFRKESLERLSSPERLDRLLQVVTPKEWLALLSLSSMVFIALIWSIFGKIPITVSGKGILIDPNQIIDMQTPLSGQLLDLKVKKGDCINQGQILAVLELPEIQKQLQSQNNNLAQLQAQEQAFITIESSKISTEKQAIAGQRKALETKRKSLEETSFILQKQEIISIEKQRQSLEQKLKNLRSLTPILSQRLAIRQNLKKQGAIADDVVLEAQQSYLNNINEIGDLIAQLQQLELQKTKVKQTYSDSQNQTNDLLAQIQELETREKTLIQQTLETATNRKNKIDEVQRNIAQLTVQLQNNSQIISPYQGCILELTAQKGQYINQGTILGTIEKTTSKQKVFNLTYFSIKDGKQIQPGMTIQITPDTVKKEEFGSIVGKVISVSPFPVSKETVTKAVGSAEIAQSLVITGGQIEVLAELQLDSTISGYKWSSSQGPNLRISRGTTASVQVIITEQSPITFVIPILKSFSSAKSN
jgi:HlyD family secretion protein